MSRENDRFTAEAEDGFDEQAKARPPQTRRNVSDELSSSIHEVSKEARLSSMTEPTVGYMTNVMMHNTEKPPGESPALRLSDSAGKPNAQTIRSMTRDELAKERERQARNASKAPVLLGDYMAAQEPSSEFTTDNIASSGLSASNSVGQPSRRRTQASSHTSDDSLKQLERQSRKLAGSMPGAVPVSAPSAAQIERTSESSTNSMLQQDAQSKQRARYSNPDTSAPILEAVTSQSLAAPQTSKTAAMLQEDARAKQRARYGNPDIRTDDLQVGTSQTTGGILPPQMTRTATMLQQDAQAKQHARSVNPESGTSDLQVVTTNTRGGIVPPVMQPMVGSVHSREDSKARERRARRTAASVASSGASTYSGSRAETVGTSITPNSMDAHSGHRGDTTTGITTLSDDESGAEEEEESRDLGVTVGAVGVYATGVVVQQRPGALTHQPLPSFGRLPTQPEPIPPRPRPPPPPPGPFRVSTSQLVQTHVMTSDHLSMSGQSQDQSQSLQMQPLPAYPTQETSIDPMIIPSEMTTTIEDTSKDEAKSALCSKKILILVCVIAILAIGGGVGVGIALGGGDDGDDGADTIDNGPTAAPTFKVEQENWDAVRRDAIKSLILEAADIPDIANLEDSETPQFAAWRWLVVDDTRLSLLTLPTSEMPREEVNAILTRFVLAVMYFSLDGGQWLFLTDEPRWLDVDANHCDWAFVDCKEGEVSGFLTGGQPPFNTDGGAVQMTGTLPMEMRFFKKLDRIRLPGNFIEDVSALAASMSSESATGSITIDFGGNPLVDDDPIYRLSNIDTFSISNCDLDGTLPPDFSRMTTLRKFDTQAWYVAVVEFISYFLIQYRLP